MDMTIAQIIKDARVRAELTQQALADKLGMSKGGVCAWEQGRAVPNRDRARMVAKVLGIRLNLISADPNGVASHDATSIAERRHEERKLKVAEIVGDIIAGARSGLREAGLSDAKVSAVLQHWTKVETEADLIRAVVDTLVA